MLSCLFLKAIIALIQGSAYLELRRGDARMIEDRK